MNVQNSEKLYWAKIKNLNNGYPYEIELVNKNCILTLITDNYYNESTSKVYVNKGDMFFNYINNCVHVNQDVNLLIFCILVMGL